MSSNDVGDGLRHIPLASLTAFRLAYLGENPNLISRISSSQFYGPIPNIWHVDSLRHAGKQRYRRRIVKSKLQTVLEKWQSTNPEANIDNNSANDNKVATTNNDTSIATPLNTHGFNIYLSNNHQVEHILHNWIAAEDEDNCPTVDDPSSEDESRFDQSFGLRRNEDPLEISSNLNSEQTTAFNSDTASPPLKHSLTPLAMEESPLGSFVAVDEEQEEEDNDGSLVPSLIINEYEPISTQVGILEAPDSPCLQQRNNERLVRFSTKQTLGSKKLKMTFQEPQPQTEIIDEEVCVAEDYSSPLKQYHLIRGITDLETLAWLSGYKRRVLKQRLMRKLHRNSKDESKELHHQLHRRIYSTLLNDYKNGEVIRSGKMLVLIETTNDTTTRYYDASTSHQYQVVDRWREYQVILRRVSEVSVRIEFYEMHSFTSLSKNFPVISYELNSKNPQSPKVSLYNAIDKTICLSVKALEKKMKNKPKNKVYLLIMKCSDNTSTLKWLYLMNLALKQSLEDGNDFHIHVPTLKRSLLITLPNDRFTKMFQTDKAMIIKELPVGYKVFHTKLIEFLKQKVCENLHITDPENWWFCFKSYDALYWIENSSESLYLLNLFLGDQLQLEFRRKENHHLEKEPIPCEGFLSRLTNNNGHRRSFGRPFYRMLYFYTSGPLLYYCRHYNAVPPPEIVENKANFGHVTTVLTSLPTDERNHFLHFDKEKDTWEDDKRGIEEIERRAKHIAKASGVLDLCCITKIRKLEDKYDIIYDALQFITWYAKPGFTNAGKKAIFVLELESGEEIWLQAANKECRDAWCSHLQMIRDYWVANRRHQIQHRMKIRHKNMHIFNINEYADSNMDHEIAISKDKVNLLSQVDEISHSIDSLALSHVTLESGTIYLKRKKHSSYTQFFLVLIPGFLIIYHLHPRSLLTHTWKRAPFFKHYFTIPIADCYIYLGQLSSLDLLDNQKALELHDGHFTIPRIYEDGWKSQDEEEERCFSIWFGKKREIFGSQKLQRNYQLQKEQFKQGTQNPNYLKLVSKLGVSGNCIYMKARSRQEKDIWVSRIQGEIDRFG